MCKIERAKSQLFKSIIDPFVNDELGKVLGIVVTLKVEGHSYAELKEIVDEVGDELYTALQLPLIVQILKLIHDVRLLNQDFPYSTHLAITLSIKTINVSSHS